jgi:arylsulfatase A-like enzyme
MPALVDGLKLIEPPKTAEEGYHLSEDLADQAIALIGNLTSLTPDKPWFTYLSFGATHAPHHVPQPYLAAVRCKFDHGYDRQRELTLERQRELGVIPADGVLTTPNEKSRRGTSSTMTIGWSAHACLRHTRRWPRMSSTRSAGCWTRWRHKRSSRTRSCSTCSGRQPDRPLLDR